MQTDTLRGFINKYVDICPGNYITKDEFHTAINEFCNETNTAEITKKKIGDRLPSIMPKVKSERLTVNGSRKRVWKGIILKDSLMDRCPGLRGVLSTERGLNLHNIKSSRSSPGHLSRDSVLSLLPDNDKIRANLFLDRIVLELDCDEEKAEEIIEHHIKVGNIVENPAGYYRKL